MNNYKVVIWATGVSGLCTDKKNGEKIDFNERGGVTVEAMLRKLVRELQTVNGAEVTEALLIHHADDPGKKVVDNLLTGERTGDFNDG